MLNEVARAEVSPELSWAEVRPEAVDMEPASVDAAVTWLDRRAQDGRFGAQLVVLRRGKTVLDRALGLADRSTRRRVDPKSLFLIYSASKPYAALCVHLLAERGLLSLDDRVAKYWPEYGRNGKESVTIRQVLQHRSGAPTRKRIVVEALVDMPSWERSIRGIEENRPRFEPGSAPAYHAFSYGFICGELVRRVTGEPIERFLRANLLEPLGLVDTFLGLPRHLWERRVTVYPAGGVGERLNAMVWNRKRFRCAVIPSVTISATARDVAAFYEMLRRGGELAGHRVLTTESVCNAREPSSENVKDGLIGRPVRWAHAFHLGGNVVEGDMGTIMGRTNSPESFGHNGNVCCSAWADPTRDLVFVYLTNKLLTIPDGIEEHREICDIILSACN